MAPPKGARKFKAARSKSNKAKASAIEGPPKTVRKAEGRALQGKNESNDTEQASTHPRAQHGIDLRSRSPARDDEPSPGLGGARSGAVPVGLRAIFPGSSETRPPQSGQGPPPSRPNTASSDHEGDRERSATRSRASLQLLRSSRDKMDHTQSPTQSNEERAASYEQYRRGLLSSTESRSLPQPSHDPEVGDSQFSRLSHASHEPATLREGGTGAVDFGSLILRRPGEPDIAENTAQIDVPWQPSAKVGGPETPGVGQRSHLQSIGTEDVLRPSQMFMQASQDASGAKKVLSPTSSRPTPGIMNQNAMSPNVAVPSSPLRRHGLLIPSSDHDTSPLRTTGNHSDTILETPAVLEPIRYKRLYPEPIAQYEPAALVPPPVADEPHSDDDLYDANDEAHERRRLAERRRARAGESLRALSFQRPGSHITEASGDDRIEVPSTNQDQPANVSAKEYLKQCNGARDTDNDDDQETVGDSQEIQVAVSSEIREGGRGRTFIRDSAVQRAGSNSQDEIIPNSRPDAEMETIPETSPVRTAASQTRSSAVPPNTSSGIKHERSDREEHGVSREPSPVVPLTEEGARIVARSSPPVSAFMVEEPARNQDASSADQQTAAPETVHGHGSAEAKDKPVRRTNTARTGKRNAPIPDDVDSSASPLSTLSATPQVTSSFPPNNDHNEVVGEVQSTVKSSTSNGGDKDTTLPELSSPAELLRQRRAARSPRKLKTYSASSRCSRGGVAKTVKKPSGRSVSADELASASSRARSGVVKIVKEPSGRSPSADELALASSRASSVAEARGLTPADRRSSRRFRKSTTLKPSHGPAAAPGNVSRRSLPLDPPGLFHGMTFAISFQSRLPGEQEDAFAKRLSQGKATEQMIRQAGGRILSDGFSELFEAAKLNAKTPEPLKILPSATRTGFTALIADGHSRKVKYMQALALGLPCLAWQWVQACISEGEVVDWCPYSLCAGASKVLGDAIRSRNLPTYDAPSAQFSDVIQQRPLLLKKTEILLVMKKSKNEQKRMQYVFLAHVLGATLVRVHGLDEARSQLREREDAGKPFDWVYVDEDLNKVDDSLFGAAREAPAGSKKRKRRTTDGASAAEEDGRLPKRIRALTDELVVQSLILGRLVKDGEMDGC